MRWRAAVPLLALAALGCRGGGPPPPAAPPLPHQARIAARLEDTDPRWARLDPGFAADLRALFARMAGLGYELALLEGHRSPQRQALLAAGGRSRAGPGRSLHTCGLAADLAFRRHGALVISERQPWAREAYQVLGREAEALGLVWGGRWSFRDLGHVEAGRAPRPSHPPTHWNRT